MAQAQQEQKKLFNAEIANFPPKEDAKLRLDLNLIVPKKTDALSQIAPPELKGWAREIVRDSKIENEKKKEADEQIERAKTVGDVKGVLDQNTAYDPQKLIQMITKADMDYRQNQKVLKQQEELKKEGQDTA